MTVLNGPVDQEDALLIGVEKKKYGEMTQQAIFELSTTHLLT